MIRIVALAVGLIASPVAALSQGTAPPAPTAAAPRPVPNCSAGEYRQLDFWVGTWSVFDTAQGYQVGTSRIERVMGGCSVKESFEAPNAPGGAYSGASFSSYDRNDGKWHQMYVDVHGNVTWFTGTREGADMVLTAAGAGGSLQRMVYRPRPDGSVQQIGHVSRDGGKTWSPGYDYVYRRA